MTQLKKQISPLRQRMIDEMNMRKLSPKTQQTYLRAVSKLATHLKHSPEHATSEQIRQFQIALVAEGASSGTINATISGIQFLYCKTLDQPDTAKRLCQVAYLLIKLEANIPYKTSTIRHFNKPI